MATGDIVASTVVAGLPSFVCGPCGTGTCCLYPMTGFGLPFPDSDLPDQVTVSGAAPIAPDGVYIHEATTESFYLTGYDSTNWDSAGGGRIHKGADLWEVQDSSLSAVTFGGCLIEINELVSVTDFFLDTYHVNSANAISRITPCRWSGPKTGGGTWQLDYGITTAYKWHLSSSGGSPTSANKTSPQSSPAGTYGAASVA